MAKLLDFEFHPREVVVAFSLINLLAVAMELSFGKYCPVSGAHKVVSLLRMRLLVLFQVANVMLFVAAAIESSVLLHIYMFYSLAFITVGLLVCLANFVLSVERGGVDSLSDFMSEVVFLFVLFTCLPVVDEYRKTLPTKTNKIPIKISFRS